jgi:hypothetical protein
MILRNEKKISKNGKLFTEEFAITKQSTRTRIQLKCIHRGAGMRVEKTATKSGELLGETKAERRKIKKLKGYESHSEVFPTLF